MLESHLADTLLLGHTESGDRTIRLDGRWTNGDGGGHRRARTDAGRRSRGLGLAARISGRSDGDIAGRSDDGLRLGLGNSILEGSGR